MVSVEEVKNLLGVSTFALKTAYPAPTPISMTNRKTENPTSRAYFTFT